VAGFLEEFLKSLEGLAAAVSVLIIGIMAVHVFAVDTFLSAATIWPFQFP